MRNCNEINTLDLSCPAPRCPVMLLLDTSSNMQGAPIDELNEWLKQFLRESAADEAASRTLELEVITFGSPANVVIPFTVIGNVDWNSLPLVAGGSSAMGAGIRLALRDLKTRRKMYRDNGISSYRPWVVLMTDGEPNDDWEPATEEMRDLGERGKIQYIGIEIGDAANHDTLCQILPSQPGPVKIKELSATRLFRWLMGKVGVTSDIPLSEEEKSYYRSIDDWGTL